MSIFGDVWGGITGAVGAIGRAVGPSIGAGIAAGIAGGITERIGGGRVPPTGGGPIGRMPTTYTPTFVQQPISTGRQPMAGFPIQNGGPVGGQYIPAFAPLQVPQPGSGLLGTDPDVVSFFEPTKTTVRATRLLTAVNPVNGKMAFWEHCGAPVLFSRDLRVCKRVAKIAARASKGRGRRRARKR